MIVLELLDKKYRIKNNLDELTISEFEKLNSILINNTEDLSFLEVLNLPLDVLAIIDDSTVKQIIKNINFKPNDYKIKKEITINNIKYKAYDKKYVMTVEEVIQIIDIIKTDNDLSKIMAIVYKENDFNLYDEKKLKEKAELFKLNMTADYLVPIISFINKNIKQNFINIYETNT